jgi:hypothetical protein
MNKVSSTLIILIFALNIFLGGSVSAQERNFLNKFDTSKHAVTATQITFNRIESAIAQSDVNLLSPYLASQTYLSLSNGIRGYYSSNQTYYVLEDFFRIYNVTSFHFDNLNLDENIPYATGIYNYEFKGKRNTSQVYVSLKKTGNSLKITQITIN